MSPPVAPPPAPVSTTRRGLLLCGAGAGLLLAGCSADDGPAPAPGRSLSPATTGGPDGADETTDDADLVGQAREALAAAAALVAASRRSVPALRVPLAPLLALHEAHAEALGQPLDLPRPAPRPAPADPLLGLVRDREEQLQARLADLALAADSGALARLLASMSAGLAQRLVRLPDAVPGGAPGGSGATDGAGRRT